MGERNAASDPHILQSLEYFYEDFDIIFTARVIGISRYRSFANEVHHPDDIIVS